MHSSICETYLVWWCSIERMVDWRRRGTSALGICAFFYMQNLFSVVVFPRSMVNWRRGYICIRYSVHSSICKTYSVYWCCIDLWSIGRGVCLPWVYMHSSIYGNLFGVVVLHRSMVN